MPSYSAKYQLTNDDDNVRQLRKDIIFQTNKAPKLLLKGDGDFKGSSVGYKDIEFTFVEKEEKIFILLIVLILIQLNMTKDDNKIFIFDK